MDELRLTGDGSHTLYSPEYGQTYHSRFGAIEESRHVFVQGVRLEELLKRNETVTLLEIGFGTGLNFWLSARPFLTGNRRLNYRAVEARLLPGETFSRLNHARLLGLEEPFDAFLRWRAGIGPADNREYYFRYDTISLGLFHGDARRADYGEETFHAIYLDAFSPDCNPEPWAEDYLKRLYRSLKPGGLLATYSSRRSVREALTACGFCVEKRPGSRGKREILSAYKP